ncbi:MAG: anti-sigma factor family protein [Pyrinomonadaceae bacterium]
MNCKHVEELMPLYVGRDLEEERARLITAHLQACTQCARSAQEYGEANQLLQLFEPPQFSEATYAAVRSSVLREIERESSAPQSIFALEFLRRTFQPRLMWAVSTSVLLAVCVFAYYFIANRTSGQRYEQANAASQQDDLKSSPSPSSKDLKPAPTGPVGASPASATNSHKPRLNLTTQAALHSKRAGGSNTPAGLLGRGPRPPVVPLTSAQYSTVEPKDPTPNTSVTSEKTLRLEIQTSDRNIRIIWFSHPLTNEGSPIESSKGI